MLADLCRPSLNERDAQNIANIVEVTIVHRNVFEEIDGDKFNPVAFDSFRVLFRP